MILTLNAESSVLELVLHSHEEHQQDSISKQIHVYTIYQRVGYTRYEPNLKC